MTTILARQHTEQLEDRRITVNGLSIYFRVYALDPPGYDQSGKPRRYYTLRDLGDFLAGWMLALDLEPAALFGSAYAAQIAMVQVILRILEDAREISDSIRIPVQNHMALSRLGSEWRYLGTATHPIHSRL